MSDRRPRLVFVRGPDAGRQVRLGGASGVIGRGTGADVAAQEETVSRTHVRYERTDEGWVFACASDGGMRVNGRKHKPGQKLLLETGDRLGIGAQTELLFVAPGDDPAAALESFLTENPDYRAHLEPAEPAPAEAPAQPAETPEPPEAEQAPAEAEDDADAAPPQSPEEAARRAKVRKYIIFGVIWAGLLLVLAIWLATRTGREPTVAGKELTYLSNEEIADIIRAPLEREHDPPAARRHLADAQDLYVRRRADPANAFRALYHYKLHLAYGRKPDLESPADLRHRDELREAVIDRVVELYDTGHARYKSKDWHGARQAYEQLLEMIPQGLGQAGDPVYDRLRDNISRFHAYVVGQIEKQEQRW